MLTVEMGPKAACRAAKGMTSPMTAQLELQTRKPLDRLWTERWWGMRSR
jgi:hypothetical protein